MLGRARLCCAVLRLLDDAMAAMAAQCPVSLQAVNCLVDEERGWRDTTRHFKDRRRARGLVFYMGRADGESSLGQKPPCPESDA